MVTGIGMKEGKVEWLGGKVKIKENGVVRLAGAVRFSRSGNEEIMFVSSDNVWLVNKDNTRRERLFL